jgi:hypothetical protein
MTANRKRLWTADLHSPLLPDPVLHVQVGDFVDHGLSSEDVEAVGAFNRMFGAGNWIAAVGNHDLYGGRTVPDDAATAWGMPAANYVHDLDFARIVVICPDDGIEADQVAMVPFTAPRLEWLDAQLSGTDLPCLIVCHWSLQDTVQADDNNESSTGGFSAQDNGDILAVLADNPTAKAWLSGHTHSQIHMPNLVKSVAVGGHQLAAVNASAPCYTGLAGNNLSSDMYTMYLTLTDGQVDVRFRNRGAGIWHVAGPDRRSRWTVTL